MHDPNELEDIVNSVTEAAQKAREIEEAASALSENNAPEDAPSEQDAASRAEKMAKIRAALAKANAGEDGEDGGEKPKPVSHAMEDTKPVSHAMEDAKPVSHAMEDEIDNEEIAGIVKPFPERKKNFKVVISDEDYGYTEPPHDDDDDKPSRRKKKKEKQPKEKQPSKLAFLKDAQMRKLFLSSAGIALAAGLVMGYFVVTGTYRNRLLPNTFINSVDVSGMTAEEAAYTILNNMTPPDLRMTDHNGEETVFKADDFDAYYSIPLDEFQAPLAENDFGWIIKLFKPSEYTAKSLYLYDPEKLRSLIEGHNWGSEETTDAHIIRSESGDFIIEPETLGDQFDTRILMTHLYDQLKDGRVTVSMLDSGCYEPYMAKVRQEDLSEELSLYNSYAKCTITYDFDDRKKKVPSDKIVDWILTTPDGSVVKDEEGRILFDREKVGVFVSQMAAETDTYGKSHSFRSVMHGWITVPCRNTDESNYGWLINQEETVDQLIRLMRAGESVTVEPEYKVRGYCRKTDDIGNTYIDVDICAQHMWVFVNNINVFEADFVSGTETIAARRTPRGTCKMRLHARNVTLGTYAVQGYECPVSFWMPFNGTGCGFHDLSRGAYGGSIYMYNGSHGCLNMSYTKAKELYELTENMDGMPVIIHD